MIRRDSSVLVDIDRGGVDRRVERLDSEGRHAISTVSVTELRLGVNRQSQSNAEAHGKAFEALERLLARFDVQDVTRATAAAAADIIDDLQRRGLSLNDLHNVYIGATARTEQLPVLTANTGHFEQIEGIQVVDWHEY